MSQFITAWNRRTGRKQRVPHHYLDSPVFEGVFALTPRAKAKAKRSKTSDADAPVTATPTITEAPADGETEKETPDA